MRNKLIKAREIEKIYQAEQGTNQTEATNKFIKELKKLEINSIVDYHKLIKEKGHEGRNIEIKYITSTPKEMAINAISEGKDVFLWEIRKSNIIYIESLDYIRNIVNIDSCKENGIDLIPTGVKNSAWLSVIGNPSIMFILKNPININSFAKKGMQIIANSLKEQFNIDVVLNGNDGLVDNKKIFAFVASEIGDYISVAFGISMKTDKEICAKIFKKKAIKIPTGIEEIVGHEINAVTFIRNIKNKFASELEMNFEHEILKPEES